MASDSDSWHGSQFPILIIRKILTQGMQLRIVICFLKVKIEFLILNMFLQIKWFKLKCVYFLANTNLEDFFAFPLLVEQLLDLALKVAPFVSFLR